MNKKILIIGGIVAALLVCCCVAVATVFVILNIVNNSAGSVAVKEFMTALNNNDSAKAKEVATAELYNQFFLPDAQGTIADEFKGTIKDVVVTKVEVQGSGITFIDFTVTYTDGEKENLRAATVVEAGKTKVDTITSNLE